MHLTEGGIVILDFGSQYNQLIARRVRELGVFAEILPFNVTMERINQSKPSGIILSGGPNSVFEKDAFLIEEEIYKLGIPVLGICYGMQLTAHLLGGKVDRGEKGEYGKAEFTKTKDSILLNEIPENSTVWMSHFDEVKSPPADFETIGVSGETLAAIQNEDRQIYAVQFHPEVTHTEFGKQILKNFIDSICKSEKHWTMKDFIQEKVEEIRTTVGDKKVILGLSGGVDSSVAAMLIHKAIGDQLTCIFVDTGLLRKNEAETVIQTYAREMDIRVIRVNAAEQFFTKLSGVTDPERKRKVIGHEFIEVFSAEAKKLKEVDYLAQGTIYPDVIESGAIEGKGPSATIKSHHNVGGLPEKLNFEILEPLKELFKDEVRKLGQEMGLHKDFVHRHPFPGPGLGIRVLGEITKEKVKILQEADAIFIEELLANDLYHNVSQAFVVLLPVKSVGVMGDERTYEYTAVLRSADTGDFMTATWSRLPYDFLEKVSSRIINEVKGINRLAFDISSKPPATIEWE